MSTLTITLPTGASVCNGKQITFKAPCDAAGVTGIIIGSTTYALVDASNTAISGGTFSSGAMVSVILDTGNYKAYVQNGKTTDIEMDSTPTSGSTNAVTSGGVYNAVREMASANVVSLTQAEYDALTTKNDDTIYVVTDEDVEYATKSSLVLATLSSTSWTGDEAPYTYILSAAGVTATSSQEILPAVDITAEQLEAYQGLNLQDGGQSAGSMTLKAFGEKATIDIPIRIIKRGDL